MSRNLSNLLLFLVLISSSWYKPFHVYSPSSKEKLLWVVEANPRGENLELKVAKKIDLNFPGQVITSHPTKPLLYVIQRAGIPERFREQLCI